MVSYKRVHPFIAEEPKLKCWSPSAFTGTMDNKWPPQRLQNAQGRVWHGTIIAQVGRKKTCGYQQQKEMVTYINKWDVHQLTISADRSKELCFLLFSEGTIDLQDHQEIRVISCFLRCLECFSQHLWGGNLVTQRLTNLVSVVSSDVQTVFVLCFFGHKRSRSEIFFCRSKLSI